MKRRTLYLPIETKCRELLGKTLLAAKAVGRGWRVFLGGIEMHDRLADGFAPGLLVENSVPDSKATRLRLLKDRGYRIADLCEESVLYPDGENYWTRKIGSRSLEVTDIILVTGAKSEREIRMHQRAAAGKLALTGNPRFDTLMPRVRAVYDDDVRAIRERYGRFLLVNSNFSSANPYKIGMDVVAALQRDGKLATPAQVDRKRRQVAYKTRHMGELQSLLVEVARAGVFDRIVLRPHPSENHDTWRAWASAFNVDVQYEGSASAWMLAAAMVLHPGCMTGIEALLLDRPVASFVPEPDSEFLNQSDAISFKIANASELLALAATWRREEGERVRAHLATGRSAMRPYIDNVEPPLSADRILDLADEIDVPETGTALYAIRRACGAMNVRGWSSRSEASRRVRMGYRRQKFSGLEAHEVSTLVARWMDAGVVERMPEITRVDRALLRLQ